MAEMDVSMEDGGVEGLDGRIVMPGDHIADLSSLQVSTVEVGAGLEPSGEGVSVILAGELRAVQHRLKTGVLAARVWVETNERRYLPSVGDVVIGQVTARAGDEYRVAIHGPYPAVLGNLAFEGATKRNRPMLLVGSSVYCMVTEAPLDAEPTLSCVHPESTQGWMSGQAVFGELQGGSSVRIPLAHARKMMFSDAPVLAALGQHFPIETAVGANGMVWVKAKEDAFTVLAVNAVANSKHLVRDDIAVMVARLVQFTAAGMEGKSA